MNALIFRLLAHKLGTSCRLLPIYAEGRLLSSSALIYFIFTKRRQPIY